MTFLGLDALAWFVLVDLVVLAASLAVALVVGRRLWRQRRPPRARKASTARLAGARSEAPRQEGAQATFEKVT